MKKISRLLLLVILCCTCCLQQAAAQTRMLTQAEYFIDTDPGAGSATPMAAADGNFDAAFEEAIASVANTLSIGNHLIGIRVLDASGNWSPAFNTVVNISDTARDLHLTQAEYYIDNDPGVGAATPMLAFDGNFSDAFEVVTESFAAPATGIHTLGVRVKDLAGNWSPDFKSTFTVLEPRAIQVTQAEYYIDTDPGVGAATPMLAFDGNFNQAFEVATETVSNTLSIGNHLIGIRVLDIAGNWSPAFRTVVNISDTARTIQVTQAEYYIDNDPGVGTATPMLAFDGNFSDAFEVVTESFAAPATGIHTLGVRVKDLAGNWSPDFKSTFSVLEPRAIQVTQAEYYIDSDPGVGAATPMLAFDGNFNQAFEVATESVSNTLSIGNHLIGIRVLDIAGNWSPAFRTVVNISDTARDLRVTQAEYFWDNDPGEGSATPLLAFDGNFDHAFEEVSGSISVYPGFHVLHVRVKNLAGIWSPPFRSTVYMDVCDTATIATSTTTVNCGDTVTITAAYSTYNGMPSFQWKKNGTNVGTNSPTFTTNTLITGDVITCEVTSATACSSGPTTSNALTFTINNPVIISMTPANGLPGSSATISGSGFLASGNTVTIAGQSAAILNQSATAITVTIPTGACSGVVQVTGNWSPDFKSTFSVLEPRAIQVTQAEYYIDSDPGVGAATPMLAFDGNFNQAFEVATETVSNTLSIGNHLIGIRVLDIAGNWSPAFRTVVNISDTARTIQVTQAEYYIDNDPGVGTATPMLAFDGNFSDAFEVVTESFAAPATGIHTLGVRVKDLAGNWSPDFKSTFSVLEPRAIQVTQAEYYIDSDPGVGAATPMLAFDGNFNQAFEVATETVSNTLSIGNHLIGIRVLDIAGNWSPAFHAVVNISDTARDLRVTQAEYFWDNDPGRNSTIRSLAFDGNFDHAFEEVSGSISVYRISCASCAG
ncbi:MAG: hypothetical protein U0T74_12375 [Chitinophagales bacterium]